MIRSKIIDAIVLTLSVFTIFLTHTLAVRVFDTLPHLEDEYAYVWQANAATRFQLSTASPPCPTCFLIPFVVDHDGVRSGKYPPGWPAVLSLGIRTDAREWVNPVLAGACVWLLYLLVKKLQGEITSILGILLLVSSPFFLINAASLLSHVWSLFLTLAFILTWFDLTSNVPKMSRFILGPLAGALLGLLILTRPLTALAVSFPFILQSIWIFSKRTGLRPGLLAVAIVAALFAGMFLFWQFAVTGSPSTNPYTLWWPYDKLGFGPGVGVTADGHSLPNAWLNFKTSFRAGSSDLFGWKGLSWILMPLGLIAVRKNTRAMLVVAIIPSMIIFYMLYWIGSETYGPRYYFEGIIGAILLTAAGVQWLWTKLIGSKLAHNSRNKVAGYAFLLIFIGLITSNIGWYLPQRLEAMQAALSESREKLLPFSTVAYQSKTPALVIVHQMQNWREYGNLTELESPFLDTPFIFIYSRQPADDEQVIRAFPDRSVWHYYADEPDELFPNLR